MSWQENRRRKRIWYRHYRDLADRLYEMIHAQGEFAPEAILELMFEAYERYRLHGKRFIAESAYESMRLACSDAGLLSMSLRANRHLLNTGRPPGLPGQLRPAAPPLPRRRDERRDWHVPGPGQEERSHDARNQPLWRMNTRVGRWERSNDGGATWHGCAPPGGDAGRAGRMPELPAGALAQLGGFQGEARVVWDSEQQLRRDNPIRSVQISLDGAIDEVPNQNPDNNPF